MFFATPSGRVTVNRRFGRIAVERHNFRITVMIIMITIVTYDRKSQWFRPTVVCWDAPKRNRAEIGKFDF